MQKGPLSGNTAVAVGLLLILMSRILLMSADDRVIARSGERISSLFEGLASESATMSYPQSSRAAKTQAWSLGEESLGSGPVSYFRYAQCVICPPQTQCADHYQVLHPSSGCTNTVACPLPLSNASTDTKEWSV